MKRVLAVDDQEDFLAGIRLVLRRQGAEVETAQTGEDAVRAVSRSTFDVALLDLGLPDTAGLALLERLLELDAALSVIVLTGRDDARTAIDALRRGALYYLTKPVESDELAVTVERAYERARLRRRADVDARGDAPVVGTSPAWRAAHDALILAARAPRTPVLLTGESGTGKEVAASIVHRASERQRGPLVTVNAASFSPALLDSELFGHEAGAFTGARGPKRGLLELASGGTLFLDEIGELPLDLQPKLLRALEGQPFRRVGGERDLRSDARVVSATNRDLGQLVARGSFRLDLYHRLRVIEVCLPKLSERDGDVERLAVHFSKRFGDEMGRGDLTIAKDALAALLAYSWPGNVRELRNVIERAVVLSPGSELVARVLPPEILRGTSGPGPAAPGPAPELAKLVDVIHAHVARVYEATDGNVTRTAEILGISRPAVRRKLHEIGIKTSSGT